MKPFILSLFLIVVSLASAQQTISLNGRISDCSDQKSLFLGSVYLWQNDSIRAKSTIDENGAYYFANLQPGIYVLDVDYLFFSYEKQELELNHDTLVNTCLEKFDGKQLSKSNLSNQLLTLYYFGLPMYDDEELNLIGQKYGVRFISLGCEVDDKYSKYIELVEELLVLRNGTNWKQAFWKEVESKLK